MACYFMQFVVVTRCVVSSDCYIFFFRQKTAYEMRIRDWSSDVCSSDLLVHRELATKPADHPEAAIDLDLGIPCIRLRRRIRRHQPLHFEIARLRGVDRRRRAETELCDIVIDHARAEHLASLEIGRESCRASVGKYVNDLVVDVCLTKETSRIKRIT